MSLKYKIKNDPGKQKTERKDSDGYNFLEPVLTL
jgi:hypothetical protein